MSCWILTLENPQKSTGSVVRSYPYWEFKNQRFSNMWKHMGNIWRTCENNCGCILLCLYVVVAVRMCLHCFELWFCIALRTHVSGRCCMFVACSSWFPYNVYWFLYALLCFCMCFVTYCKRCYLCCVCVVVVVLYIFVCFVCVCFALPSYVFVTCCVCVIVSCTSLLFIVLRMLFIVLCMRLFVLSVSIDLHLQVYRSLYVVLLICICFFWLFICVCWFYQLIATCFRVCARCRSLLNLICAMNLLCIDVLFHIGGLC